MSKSKKRNLAFSGDAGSWQEALDERMEDLTAYLLWAFKGSGDVHEKVQEAIGLVVRYVERNWRPGRNLPIKLTFTILEVENGMGLARTHRRRHKTFNLEAARYAAERQRNEDTRIDVQGALARLTGFQERIMKMLMEGYRWEEICQELRTNIWQVHNARNALRRLLADYYH